MPILASPTLVLTAACDIQRLDGQDAQPPPLPVSTLTSPLCAYTIDSHLSTPRWDSLKSFWFGLVCSILVTDVFSDFIEMGFQIVLKLKSLPASAF